MEKLDMTDKVRAYILMDLELGRTDEVVEAIRRIDEVTNVAVTTGNYDAVVLLETNTLEELYDITVQKIHKIPGIKETQTAVVEKMIRE
jgi:DNA-binding Lrp family transcriptional regulator